ncbi:hypothetical protein B7494_g7298 [Chlorociboria aeruginascens]|nr:hypothetical protein B7494_g7298 [Chlorociboria aeruginascens]
MRFLSTLMAAFAMTNIVNALSSSLQQVTGFTSTPTRATMYIYIPTARKTPAAIIVAIHYCSGTASAYYSGSLYAQYADTYGYIVIYPNSPSSGGCWDVASTASLTHNGGGDSQTIVNMVTYAVNNYGGDASRVYVTGSSSGAMMTNVLAGAYPEVFQAGSAYSGVPDGCFYVAGSTANMATPGWSNTCANGQIYWQLPKTVALHGTVDSILYYPNLGEELKQWSDVLGVSFNHNVTNSPQSQYTQMVYGDGTKLIGYSAVGVGHTVPIHETVDLAWFCISPTCEGTSSSSSVVGTSTATSLATSTATSSAPATTSSTAPGGGSIAEWGQCGGMGWTGSGTCVSGTTCTYSNAYYSQCLPA